MGHTSTQDLPHRDKLPKPIATKHETVMLDGKPVKAVIHVYPPTPEPEFTSWVPRAWKHKEGCE